MYSGPEFNSSKKNEFLKEKGVQVFGKTVFYLSQKTPLLHSQIVSLFEPSLLGTKIFPIVHLNWSLYNTILMFL